LVSISKISQGKMRQRFTCTALVTLILHRNFRSLVRSIPLDNVPPTIVLDLVLPGVLGYLIGSIPTAFLLVRWRSNVDIRDEGSGNVGALNSFQVTRSKLLGASVLLLDLIKGISAVQLVSVLIGQQFSIQATAGVAAVVGHDFPVWLKFKGGRGLATAAGVMLVFAWPVVPIWVFLWAIGYALTRHVNMGNTIASGAGMIGILVAPLEVLSALVCLEVAPAEFRVFGVALFAVILAKHVGPVGDYFEKSGVSQK
jgi:glycerol-3-phosphate acyltransferase PlsY